MNCEARACRQLAAGPWFGFPEAPYGDARFISCGRGVDMGRRYGWRDDQWAPIQPVLPGRAATVGVTATDHRLCVEAVRLPRKNRNGQRRDAEELSKARHLLEHFFAKRKQCRGLATRYDQRARTFLGAV